MSNYTESILHEIESKENGSFQITSLNKKAYLTVFKPGRQGKAVTRHEVIQRLKLFNITDYDPKQVETIVLNADGKEHEIAPWEGVEPIDSRIEIEVADDKMSASIIFYPPLHGGKALSIEDMKGLLHANGIHFGIKEDIIKDLVDNQKFFLKTPIAQGIAPIPPINGSIKVHFEPEAKPHIEEDAFGRVDFKNIQIIKSIKKDAILAEMIDPKPGVKGKNIFSEEVDAGNPQEVKWKIGPNCQLSEDGKKLFSMIDGRPVLDREGMIRVDEVILLDKVDYSTGNVDFPGTIIVEGTIADNFTLRTKGSLIIKKSVGRVFLYAEKDIVLSGGVMGKNGGIIESKCDIYAKFVEQGTLKAGKTIFIAEAALHSELVAGEAVIIKGGRAELIGGETIAGKYVSVGKLGAVVETRTNLIVGMAPEILDELKKMKDEIRGHEEVLYKVKQTISRLTDSKKEHLSSEERDMLKKLIEVEKKYTGLLNNSKTQYETLVVTYEPAEDAYVEIDKSIFPKVNINFGRGKVYNSDLNTINNHCFIYNDPDGFPGVNNNLPKKK